MQNPVVAFVIIAIVVVIAIFLLIKAMQTIGLEKVCEFVYQSFVDAEHNFQYGDNEQKFDYVVQLARSAIPSPFNLFITKSFLKKTVQLWFDLCKG